MAKPMSESLAGTERLMEEVCELENCKQALQRVKANKGSPGVDGMTVDELPEYLKQHGLKIGEQLRNGTYQPQPVRRVEIPKPDGQGVRKLGIPCVLDRFVQQAVLQVLQKRWDPTFSEHSHGFDRGAARGKRCTRRSSTLPKGTAGWWTSTWKIFRSSQSRPSVSGGGRARRRRGDPSPMPIELSLICTQGSAFLSPKTSAVKASMTAPFCHASSGKPALRQVCSRKVVRSQSCSTGTWGRSKPRLPCMLISNP
jgi:hypothetical protein